MKILKRFLAAIALGIIILGLLYGPRLLLAVLMADTSQTSRAVREDTPFSFASRPSHESGEVVEGMSDEQIRAIEEAQRNSMWDEAPIFIDDIDPKTITTTEKLHEVFDGFIIFNIPTVFIEQLPQDFAQQGDKDLFVKAVLPLFVRENMRIADERKFLLSVQQKAHKHIPLSAQEEVRFDELSKKYDTFRHKTFDGKLNELLEKVDVVPNSIGVVQMGLQTNWGRKNFDSPLGQRHWENGQYVYRKFDNLPEAVADYMKEINSLIQYQAFRTHRKTHRHLRGGLGEKLVRYLDHFEPDDATYSDRLQAEYKILKGQGLDDAALWKKIDLYEKK